MKMVIILNVLCVLLQVVTAGAFSNPLENTTKSATPEYLDLLLKSKQYDEFSKLLHIDDVNRIQPSKGQYRGDTIYQPWQIQTAQPTTANYKRYSIKKWENNEVPFAISSDYTIVQKRTIVAVILRFNRIVDSVKFRPRRSSDRNYVFFFSGNGCFSNLGRKGGVQGLSLKTACLDQGSIQHEMMHAIGISHEHERYDRDNYIRLHYNNIPKDILDQFEKMYIEGFGPLGEYDYYSIMHYPMILPNGKQAFSVLKRNIKTELMGKRTTMTFKDLHNVKKLYGEKPVTTLRGGRVSEKYTRDGFGGMNYV